MDKHNLYSDNIDNNNPYTQKMKAKDQLLSLLLNFVSLVLITLIGYAYLADKASANEKITTEVINRKEACEDIKKELDCKVDKDAFSEWKAGQNKILEYINEANKREHIYQDMIRKLSFMDIDTVTMDYMPLNLTIDGNIQ